MNPHNSSSSMPMSYKAQLALIEALEACFVALDWSKLGLEMELPYLTHSETRLQKALRFNDSDYGTEVAQLVTFMAMHKPDLLHSLPRRPALKAWLEQNAPAVAQELGLSVVHVPAPFRRLTASEVVERALRDADQLLQTNGAVSALDRVHTALHGYLLDVCAASGLTAIPTAPIGSLFKTIRNEHPSLVAMNKHDPQVDVVLASLAGAVTALNTLRNNASVAHPNQVLLREGEAMLMVNLVRTLFNYLETRLDH
ncbi:hypothetical protein CCR98_02180 [Stenotrophomonas sp. WZN-1]|uniref:abortive infection family protein n=1 Tax=Stenotrophomonas sp. WZN-1 TaxID=2005046 RepID=UPI000B446197|nr:abortive infection family protein [Stenotrophomonas sp. WZN-1]ARZ73033.1 hypothetical protein CCR98_02180 [Stenotrophomonas sp. WZN-1]